MARRQPGAAVAETNGHTESPVAVTAAARPVDLVGAERLGYRRKAKRETWQEEAWSFFDIVGEVKQPTYFLANTCSLVRPFIGYQPDPEQDPVIAPQGMAGVFEANDILDRMEAGSRGGIAGMLRESIINHKVAGECWVAGIDAKAAVAPSQENPDGEPFEPETWDVRSVSEVFTKGSGKNMRYWYREDPEDRSGKAFPVDRTMLTRVWQEHPEFSELADCALRALLTECEELLILTRAVKAVGRSRLAGAGILFLSNDLEAVSPPRRSTQPAGEEKKEQTFIEKLMDAMTIPIQNEGDPSGVVPLLVRGSTEAIEKGVRYERFDRELDKVMIEQRRELIQRLAQGSDVPIEVVVGLKNINHWTAFQVDQSTWSRYGHPAVLTVFNGWTAGILRPMLVDYGISPEVAQRLLFWYDPAEAITQPDRSANVIAAFDRFGISWNALRTYLQLSDNDAPDDAEIQRRIDIAVAAKGSSNGSGDSSSSPAGDAAPNDGVPPSSPDARAQVLGLSVGQVEALEEALPGVSEYLRANDGHIPAIVPYTGRARTAAARPARRKSGEPLGRRLMSIDRRLREGLQHAADAAMMRALDKAGARVRNRAKKSPALASSVRDLAAHDVPARLGEHVVRTLGFESDDELLADGFDAMEPAFYQKVSAAQQTTLDLLAADYNLDEEEIRALANQQQRDRVDAWAWLAGALVVLGHERLYNPQPQAPERGEFDASASVPPDMLREAMARAGGAPGGLVTTDNRPVGGVATGDLVMDVWRTHGQVVSGWEWVYGDPSTRTTPFEPHADLDGVQFDTWQDDVLANSSDWPPVEFLHPGDHMWCQCDFVAVGPGALGGDEDEEAADDEAMAAE